ncbi:AraC family transcriptional regulator [Selenomonas sp. KH1T6]|uniref:AraC family transcriptional regulator n=1 Tax=Selenomonas sp. KH1T6 TaxID=3158784 RepID=UPI0008A776E7|nr:AraC-type DNA-binding protein [Selenomonas ruminantium]
MENIKIVRSQLMAMNEDECFYKSYQEAKHSGQLENFLTTQNPAELAKRKLILQELLPESARTVLVDAEYFAESESRAVFLSKHNRFTPPFWHNHVFFEIICVVEGRAQQLIGQETMPLQAGDFCLVSPALVHSLSVMDEDSLVLNLLLRRKTIADSFFPLLRDDGAVADFLRGSLYQKEHPGYLLFRTGESGFPRAVLEMYAEQERNDRYSDRIISGLVTILLTRLMRDFAHDAKSPATLEGSEEAAEFLHYIMNNLTDVTLEKVATHLGYSLPYTCRLIKKWTGSNFKDLVLRIRFERAARLLKDTRMSVRQISEAVGYENPENFMRMFKKRYGLSPSSYRKAQ